MTSIILHAIAAMLLEERFGPASGVGGVTTVMAILVLIAWAVAAHEARSGPRGVVNWIVSIIASVIGGLAALIFISFAIDMMLPFLPIEGSIDSSEHPVKYVLVAATAILVVLGSWIPLRATRRLDKEKAAPDIAGAAFEKQSKAR
ncbi:hypothetical protein [Bradyrhizobium sp. B117]|uniref:hypothetical protein n=1 Tax=Bradyrhizobium sp. B117 TaxID=3140246 RepID=UPI0031845C43